MHKLGTATSFSQSESVDIDPQQRSMKLLVREGAHANVFIVLSGGAFLTGLALFLGAGDFEIGLLAAAPFLMQTLQLVSPYVFRVPSMLKDRVATTLGVSRFLWLVMIPILFLSGPWRLPVLLGTVLLSGLLTMISVPAWLSWMADAVPETHRGRFFSRRNAVISGTTVAATIWGSLILDWSRGSNDAYGYAAIILLSLVGALMAWRSMQAMPNGYRNVDASISEKPNTLAPLRDRAFGRVLMVFSAWNAAVGLSAAFFAPHMLLNLKMSFFQIGIYTSATALVAILSSRTWGTLIDKYGSRVILNISAFGIGLIPVVWLFPCADTLWILLPEAIYSGVLWAGFNLAAFTLPLDKSPRQNRSAYLSMFAAVTGLSFVVASLAAGCLAESLSGWSTVIVGHEMINYHVLFVISAALRILTAILISLFREPSELRLPIIIQLMGYGVLKRMSVGRQILPFVADAYSQGSTKRSNAHHNNLYRKQDS